MVISYYCWHIVMYIQLMQTVVNETLLEQIVKEAQHNFLRLRTMFVIDQLAQELKDPVIISHWNLFNSPTQSCVRINIVTQVGNELLHCFDLLE